MSDIYRTGGDKSWNMSSSAEPYQPRTFVNKSRCHKCVYEMTCLRNKDIEGKCPDYKRDAPDGGYYG